MKRLLYIFIIACLPLRNFSQNALQSSEKLQQLRQYKDSLEPLLRELSKYIKIQPGTKGIDLANTFKFKSDFLRDYMKSTLTSTALALNASLLRNFPVSNIPTQVDSMLGALSLPLPKKNYRTFIDTVLYKFKAGEIDSPLFKKLRETAYELAVKNYTISGTSTASVNAKQQLEMLSKALAPSQSGQINFNNVFEVQSLDAYRKSIKLPSESDAIDALAIFLVSRVKKESVIAFVSYINKNIDKLQPLPCLFKNTTHELASFSPGQADAFGSITQKAIAIDLAEMPDNISKCNFCGKNEINKYENFTQFFNDISGGVDLITNINFYAGMDKKNVSDKNFYYVLQLLTFINKYYSYIYQKEEAKQTWLDPEFASGNNDTLLKLSLALVYEKEHEIFNQFLQTRFSNANISNLNELFQDSSAFTEFKTNFRKLFYSLHRLDSYWKNNKVNNIALVSMAEYKAKIAEVFKDIYALMHYDLQSFPLNNDLYNMYLSAKTAVSEKDVSSIVYYSQKMLDFLSCYEIELRGFRMPNFELKHGFSLPLRTGYLNDIQLLKMKGKISTRMNGFPELSLIFSNSELMTKFTLDILRLNITSDCKFFMWSFLDHKNTMEKHLIKGDYRSAMELKFNPWWHPFMFVFRNHYWKLSYDIFKLRQLHMRQRTLKNSPGFYCYMKNEEKLYNKFSYSSSRRDVSQLLNFFTDIAGSKDSKQLSQIIEKYAEPSQSYRIKRFNSFSWDINAYPGLYTGVETKVGKGNSPYAKDSITTVSSGITAPIGISFSWAGRSKFKCEYADEYPAYVNKRGNIKSFKGGCISLSFMIIDIGAAVSYRFSHDTSHALPKEVNFNQVLAPGFYIGYGLPNLPLVVNAGIQYTPQLRTFNGENGKLFDVYRLGLSLTYDIPLLNITHTNKHLRNNSK